MLVVTFANLCTYRKRKEKFPLLEKNLIQFMTYLRAKGILISQVLIRENAKVLTADAKFQASTGWCAAKFMKQNGLRPRKVTK